MCLSLQRHVVAIVILLLYKLHLAMLAKELWVFQSCTCPYAVLRDVGMFSFFCQYASLEVS